MSTDAGQIAVTTRQSFSRVAHLGNELPTGLAEQLWLDPAALMKCGETLQRTGLRNTVRLHWGDRQYVMKHYQPSWWHAVRQLVTPSRAWATASATLKLVDGGIATPRPAACIENRWGVLRRDSFLMYPYLEGRTLRSYFKNEAKQSRTVAESLWQQLHELWGRLQMLQASLADTNTGNFIICPAGRLWVIDLDKARFHRLPKVAAKHQERGWKQLLRSAAKC
jgi:hypothetical protein